MIRCPAPGERYSAKSFDGAALRHQGAENSALKNKAPFRLTSLKTSESTSIFIAYLNTASVPRIRDDGSNIQQPIGRTLRLDNKQYGSKIGSNTRTEGDWHDECDCER